MDSTTSWNFHRWFEWMIDLFDEKEFWKIFEVVQRISAWSRNHPNKKIKYLWLDPRGEYLSYEFSKHHKSWWVVPQLMPPETPQVYGVFERHNQTLLDMVRSMMLSTKLPLYFWDLCFRDYRFYTEKSAIIIRWNDTIWVMGWVETQIVFSWILAC